MLFQACLGAEDELTQRQKSMKQYAENQEKLERKVRELQDMVTIVRTTRPCPNCGVSPLKRAMGEY